VVAWDPSAAHSGRAIDGQPWTSRLLVVKPADLAQLAGDSESDALADVAFPEPILSGPDLIGGFLCLHHALEAPTTPLERDERLAEWLRDMIERSGQRPSRPHLVGRDDRALRLACDYLGDRPELNVSLDELAAATEIGKFRLVRLFRERIGLPPHALQIGHRILRARRLLEAGETITQAALTAGFSDQSHLHRHFQRSLGITPRQYQLRLRTPPPAPPLSPTTGTDQSPTSSATTSLAQTR